MRMSLRGLKETWHLFLCQFLKDCQALCHRSWLEVFQLKWGKCWFSCIRRFLWECDYSVKMFSESEAVYLPVAPVSQPSPAVAVSLGSCRLSPLSWTCSALLLLAVVQAGKLLGFLGKPEACLVRLQLLVPHRLYVRGPNLWLLEQSVSEGGVWLLFCFVITDVLDELFWNRF